MPSKRYLRFWSVLTKCNKLTITKTLPPFFGRGYGNCKFGPMSRLGPREWMAANKNLLEMWEQWIQKDQA
jgi:hypothetical protein